MMAPLIALTTTISLLLLKRGGRMAPLRSFVYVYTIQTAQSPALPTQWDSGHWLKGTSTAIATRIKKEDLRMTVSLQSPLLLSSVVVGMDKPQARVQTFARLKMRGTLLTGPSKQGG